MDENIKFVLHNELAHMRENLRALHNLKEVGIVYQIVITDNTTHESFVLGYVDSNYGAIDTLQHELKMMLKEYGDYHVLLNGFPVNRHKDDYLEIAEQVAKRHDHLDT